MNILQINNKFVGTGAENVMKSLGCQLNKKGYKVYYATYECEDTSKDIFRINNPMMNVVNSINKIDKYINKNNIMEDPNKSLMKNMSINLRNMIPLHDPITEISFSRIIKNLKPDVIHCHNILPSLSPISVAKENNIPVIITLHGYWPICPLAHFKQIRTNEICTPFDGNWSICKNFCAYVDIEKRMNKLKKFIDNNVNLLIPVSNYLKNKLTKCYSEEKIKTIYNGIDTEIFRGKDNCTEHIVLHIGRLSYHKGSDIFLDVAKNLSDIKDLKFILIGTGLRNFSNSNNIEYLNKIPINKLIELYSRALCTVVPSTWPEPHPLVTLESMSCKTPVIGSKIAGIEESILDNKTGFLIRIDNKKEMIKDISDKIVYLYNNRKIRLDMGNESRNFVKKKFSIQNMLTQYIKVYDDLV